jgi:hypothetical protein
MSLGPHSSLTSSKGRTVHFSFQDISKTGQDIIVRERGTHDLHSVPIASCALVAAGIRERSMPVARSISHKCPDRVRAPSINGRASRRYREAVSGSDVVEGLRASGSRHLEAH